MAESNKILTQAFRANLAKLVAGTISTVSPVRYAVLGDGGVNGDGAPVAPGIDQEALTHELCRYEVSAPEFPAETTARFSATVPEAEQDGAAFSEMALADADGALVAIRTMRVKQKDSDEKMIFTFDIEF